MNFFSLILPKIINHKRFELFEFSRLVHLLEIMGYHRWDLESRKVGVAIVLAVWRCYGQNGPNLANFLLSTTLQVPKLHQQWNEIFRRCSTWSHSKSKDRSWVVNFLSLILPKIINHKRFELFEFRLLAHLVEIMCYHRWFLGPRKVK